MLDRLVAHMKRQEGVVFSTLRDEACRRLQAQVQRRVGPAR